MLPSLSLNQAALAPPAHDDAPPGYASTITSKPP